MFFDAYEQMSHKPVSIAVAFLLFFGIVCGKTAAALLPGDFVVHLMAERWKDDPGVAIEREVIRAGSPVPILERVFLKGGRVRVESPEGIWTYPAPVSALAAASKARPIWIDALLGMPSEKLLDSLKVLGIPVEKVTLRKVETPGAPLPFMVAYAVGGDGPGVARIEIQKDAWRLLELQFRPSAQGPVWRVEYRGHGANERLPGWLPTELEVYRDDVHYESMKVVRVLDVKVSDRDFEPGASNSAPGNDGD